MIDFIGNDQTLLSTHNRPFYLQIDYSTVTALARLRGWSTSVPLINAI